MSKLFSSLKMRSLILSNRTFVAPMCQYSYHDGKPDDWHLDHLATGAVGLISAVVQAGQIVATGLADVILSGRELPRNPCRS